MTITKCKEEIAKLRNTEINLAELAFTKEYNMGIERQPNLNEWNIYNETVLEKERKEELVQIQRQQSRRSSSVLTSVNVSSLMNKKRRSSKSWGFSRMNSVRLMEGHAGRDHRLNSKLDQDIVLNPTPTSAALEFLNQSAFMMGSGTANNRHRSSISKNTNNRGLVPKSGQTIQRTNTQYNNMPKSAAKRRLMKERLIEQEEYINPFEGFNDSEVYGGPSATSQGSSSRTRSQSDMVHNSNTSLFSNNLVVPRLDIGTTKSPTNAFPVPRITNVVANGK